MSTTKERPIIFSGPMVRAILEGRKTQTRRVVKRSGDMEFDPVGPHYGPYWLPYATKADGKDAKVRCPYGKPGDRLWVRETHAVVPRSAFRCSTGVQQTLSPNNEHDAVIYREGWERSTGGIRWRPSIYMPRWASRITLEITGIRVERLQQISEADAMAEGCPLVNPDPFIPGHGASSASGWFSDLWEQIHGAGSWEANPWVWVVEFQRQGVTA